MSAPERIVLESTSSSHQTTLLALAEAELPVIVATPRHGRDFIRGLGRRAKTDALDARLIARFAAVAQPAFRPVPTVQELEFKALVTRRRHRIAAITLPRNQREAAPAARHEPWFDELIAQQQAVLARLETEIAARIAAQHNAKKVGIVACMPKLLTLLNAMLRDGCRWRPAMTT